MIGLRLTVPIACWRKGHARELLETEPLPPPATCYGTLLSLVGETERERHRGCRVTAALLNDPPRSSVLRTLWQVKSKATPQGNNQNAGPDIQQLLVGSDLMVWCDSDEESNPKNGLEARVRASLENPESITRFGGWSLGESTHLINDVWLVESGIPPGPCLAFLANAEGSVTLPTWVDHVGSAGTLYAVGEFERIMVAPAVPRIPRIPLAPALPAVPETARRSRKKVGAL